MKLDKGAMLSGISVAGTALAMLAMYGDKAFKALAGVPTLLQAFSAQLPLGVSSFVLALILSALVWLSAERAHFTGRFYNPDTVTICTAVLVTTGQQWLSETKSPGAILTALILGLIAGLVVPYLCRLIIGKRLNENQKEKESK